MRKLFSIILLFVSFQISAQTQTSLPVNSVAFGSVYLAPDGSVWAGATGKTFKKIGLQANISTLNDSITALRTSVNGKVDKFAGKSLLSDSEIMRLLGMATGATANSTDAQLRDRTTHTGFQGISTITGLQTALDGKQATLSGTGIVKSTAGTISYLTDPLPIANGGTGSATQNFVDLTTDQTIAGAKSLTGPLSAISANFSASVNVFGNASVYGSFAPRLLPIGTGGTDSIVVYNNTSKTLSRLSPSFYLTPTGSGAGLTNLTAANISAGTAGISITGNAATVTTNANLTGPITSVGNATSVASQTGIGSTFVMNTSPTLVTPNLGNATGGTLSLSGGITSTMGNNALLYSSASATTGFQYMQMLNNVGHTLFGIEGAVAGNLLTNGTANASVFTSLGATNLELGTNQTKRFTIAHTTGALTSSNLAGTGDRLLYANSSGGFTTAVIGSGLSLSAGTLTATGGSAGTVTGSGTAGFLTKWNSASDVGNSIVSQSGSILNIGGTVTSTLGNNQIIFNSASATTGWQILQMLNTTAHTIFGIEGTVAGSLLTNGTANASVFTSVGATNLELGTNQTKRVTIAHTTGNVNATGTIIAANLSGTNTGDQTNITGNAATATNVAYSGLTGVVPTWNQNTTGNAATVTTNANLTGDVTSVGNTTSIATNVVVNSDLAQVATKTYKGRTSALTGNIEDVAVATLKTDLTLVKADVGLGSVDNTSDAAKPVSTATQTALDLKANLNSPALTGAPTSPTAAAGTNTTQIATTAFVTSAVGTTVSGGLVFSGDGVTTEFNTTLSTGQKLLLTATSADSSGNMHVVSAIGCAGLCEEWRIRFTTAPPSGTNNVSFSYIRK